MRLLLKVVLTVFMLSPAVAQDLGSDRPWEESVTGQIEALRQGDGAAALSFAGGGFQTAYTNPQDFIRDIERSGYTPIGASRSHSFGAYREVSPDIVVVAVELVGTGGRVWDAVYQVHNSPEGWRVQGVVLRSTQGIGI